MASKKGLSYVDWVISLGTFLIAVIFIFILIRPTLQPASEKENLMQLVQQKFLESAEWSIHEVPLFVRKLQKEYDNNGETATALIAVNYSSEYSLTTHQQPGSNLAVHGGHPLSVKCDASACVNDEVTIVIYPSSSSENPVYLGMQCHPQDVLICDATLGATSTIKGIRQEQLSMLQQQGYAGLKNSWNIPANNDFAIYIDNVPLVTSPPMPQQGNVVVKEMKYWKIDRDNVRTSITILFQAW